MLGPDPDTLDKPAWVRLGIWGTAALVAILTAVVAGQSERATNRVRTAYMVTPPPSPIVPPPMPAAQLPPRPSEFEIEARRLADGVRMLTADRELLLTRLGAIERNLEDITGSIGERVRATAPGPRTNTPEARPAAPEAPAAASPAPTVAATLDHSREPKRPVPSPSFTATAAMVPASLPPPTASFASPSRVANVRALATGDKLVEDSVASRTEFGVDIGGAANIDALRVLWANAKNSQAPLFDGLRPIMTIREGKQGAVVLRLVVGPLANAAAAARLCATLVAAGQPCQQTVFDGQKLALR